MFRCRPRCRGCSRSGRSGIPQQFLQRPVSFNTPHTLSTVVASTTLDSDNAKIVHPTVACEWQKFLLAHRPWGTFREFVLAERPSAAMSGGETSAVRRLNRPLLRLPNRKHVFLGSTHTPEQLHNHRWKLYAWRISGRKNWPPWAGTAALLQNCLYIGPRPHCRFITGR